ncbi:MAG: hypothetical protein ACP5JG_13080 [Anaerolineae bacterium]
MAKRNPSGDDEELLDIPEKDERFIEPPAEEEEERRPERRKPWQKDAGQAAREEREKTIEGKPDVPPDVVGRLDEGAGDETEEAPGDVVGREDQGAKPEGEA